MEYSALFKTAMRTLPLYTDLVESIVHETIHDIEKSEKLTRMLHQAYRLEHNQTACCFNTVLVPFYKQLTNYYQSINPHYQKPEKMGNDNLEFQLKPGMKLTVPFNGAMQQVNEDNLNNDNAVAVLATNPGRKNCFKKLPPDWEKRVADYKKANGDPKEELKNIQNKAADKKADNGSDEVKKVHSKMTKDQLTEVAVQMELPAEEYSEMNKTDLLAYLTEKQEA